MKSDCCNTYTASVHESWDETRPFLFFFKKKVHVIGDQIGSSCSNCGQIHWLDEPEHYRSEMP